MTTTEINKPTGIIKVDKGKLQIQLYVGILILFVGFVVPELAASGVLLITMYLVNSSIEIVRFYPEHSEVKQGLIRSRWLIADANVISANKVDEYLVLSLLQEGEMKELKISLKPFSIEDRNSIVRYYKAQVSKNK